MYLLLHIYCMRLIAMVKHHPCSLELHTQYPPGCPLLQLSCPSPIASHLPPQVTWRQGKAVLLYEDSLLIRSGSDACNSVEAINGSTLPVVVSADSAAFWLIVRFCTMCTIHHNSLQCHSHEYTHISASHVSSLQPHPTLSNNYVV